MDEISKAIQANHKKKLQQISDQFSDELEKARALPVGTIKKRGPNNMIKTANGWKYHSRANGSQSTRSSDSQSSKSGKKEEFSQDNLPSVGDKVQVGTDITVISYEPFKGQTLEVEKIVDTGLISEPKQIKVKNDRGDSIIMSPKDLKPAEQSSSNTSKTTVAGNVVSTIRNDIKSGGEKAEKATRRFTKLVSEGKLSEKQMKTIVPLLEKHIKNKKSGVKDTNLAYKDSMGNRFQIRVKDGGDKVSLVGQHGTSQSLSSLAYNIPPATADGDKAQKQYVKNKIVEAVKEAGGDDKKAARLISEKLNIFGINATK